MIFLVHFARRVARGEKNFQLTLLLFLTSIGFQICLAMVLRWRATRAGSAIKSYKHAVDFVPFDVFRLMTLWENQSVGYNVYYKLRGASFSFQRFLE